jgi:hypothetical protein
VQPRQVDRFYTRHQPPAGPESFHDQMQRVQRVVGPEAAGAQTNVKTDYHAGPAQVERHDLGGNASGGVNARRGNVEVPRVDVPETRGANGVGHQPNIEGNGHGAVRSDAGGGNNAGNEGGKEASPGGSRRFGNGNGPNNAGIGPSAGPGPKDSPANMAPGADDLAQNKAPASGNAGKDTSGATSTQDNKRGDRGGWSKFGSPAGKSDSGNAGRQEQTTPPASRSTDQGRVPRSDNTPDSGRGKNDNSNWQKFPGTGQGNDRPVGEHGGQSQDRSVTPAQTPGRSDDRGGWQRFPSNSDHGARPTGTPANDSSDRSGGNSKPPLELHRPIVTPRQPETRNEPRYTPPPPSRTDTRSEPRYTPPPAPRSEPRYTPSPSGSQRSEPRYTPPARTETHHDSHSSSGSSSRSSGGDHGSHSDSKSSSNPKQR